MILKALGTFPLRYLVNIFPIYPKTLLTSGLSMDFSSTSLSFFSKISSQLFPAFVCVSPKIFIRLIYASIVSLISCGFYIYMSSFYYF